jgi:hypothetical protein
MDLLRRRENSAVAVRPWLHRRGSQVESMGHLLDRGDVLDVLEESAVLSRPVHVELKGGTSFVDQTRFVVSEDGEDWAVFRYYDTVPVSKIAFVAPTAPNVSDYRGKFAR